MNDTATDARILIIGYGNPLRGDDAVGWVAVQKLAAQFDPAQVSTLAVHLLMPELADMLSKVDLAIFIDAADGQTPGQLSSVTVAPMNQTQSMTHQMSPHGLLAMARQLFGHCPEAHLFTIGGDDFGHKEGLTETVANACDELVKRVCGTIEARKDQTHEIRNPKRT